LATVQGVFVALFGRPADPAGLAYLTGLTKNGSDWSRLSALSAQDEFQARFSGLSDKAAVSLLYQTVFGRAPELSGLNYWLSQLQSGHYDRATLGVAMLDGAKDSDLAMAGSKLAAADLFTTHLDLPMEQKMYAGSFASQTGRAFLSGVTPEKSAAIPAIDDAILRLVQSGAQKPADGQKVVLVFTSPDLVKLDAEPAIGSVILKAATLNNIEFNTWGISGQDAAAFSIDANNGAISLKSAGYVNAKEVVNFTVMATDAAGNSASQVVTVALAGQKTTASLTHEPSPADSAWSPSHPDVSVGILGLGHAPSDGHFI